MRKVTQTTVDAFMDDEYAKVGSTETDGNRYFLHGNLIAYKQDDDVMVVNDCGQLTATTYDRLHALIFAWTNGKFGASRRNGGVIIDRESREEIPLLADTAIDRDYGILGTVTE